VPQPRVLGIVLVETKSLHNVDDEAGVWIALLTPVVAFASGGK